MLIDKIKTLCSLYSGEIIADRRHMHQHPELSFHEHETAAYIKKLLDLLEVPWRASAGTGIIGTITGSKPSSTVVALRADIDALPIDEENDTPYRSVHKGIMHACGHDVHTASLLGVARIAQALKDDFAGQIKLIFQPAEEKYPGGAKAMVEEGFLNYPGLDAVIGQHTMPELEAGKVGMKPGRYMASNDELYITIRGRGGHGAQPHLNVDPVVIASHVIIALQQIVSRIANPAMPTVLSIGKMFAAGSTNIIPEEVYLEGTLRTLDETWRKEVHAHIEKIAKGISESMGGTCNVKIQGFPGVHNNEELTAKVFQYAVEYLGKENVVTLNTWMAGEDFGEFSQLAESCYYRLGVGNKAKGINSSLHTPTFDVDELNVFNMSSGLMAYIALRRLGNK
ncbi:M20 metallopeptidase family protein [Chitinophaga defluvii]|uniref:M20 family metallopeptidase n=1 Tax=Chitinophaga defluvii TaxID=3163343 RepID=A0ABV2TBA3_9BACT